MPIKHHLPPVWIFSVDNLKDVSPREAHAGLPTGDEVVVCWVVVEVRPHIDLRGTQAQFCVSFIHYMLGDLALLFFCLFMVITSVYADSFLVFFRLKISRHMLRNIHQLLRRDYRTNKT